MDQPGKVANPILVSGYLNRENEYSPVPVRAGGFGLARRVQPSRPTSACSFSILRLNLVVLLTGFLPISRCVRKGIQTLYAQMEQLRRKYVK